MSDEKKNLSAAIETALWATELILMGKTLLVRLQIWAEKDTPTTDELEALRAETKKRISEYDAIVAARSGSAGG
jgi:hypothetical protein